ncbi:MAG: thermonuclease family protein [Candidatus Omnitrophota bacterium]
MKRLFLLMALGLFLCGNTTICLAQDATTKASPNYDNIKVTKVISGDTLELENGETVKLIGIVAPKADTEMAKEARDFIKELEVDANIKVRLEFDVQKRDKSGRLLAYIYYEVDREKMREVDYTQGLGDKFYFFINATIIAAGYAKPIAEPPNTKYADLFEKLHQEAKENNRGMWKK